MFLKCFFLQRRLHICCCLTEPLSLLKISTFHLSSCSSLPTPRYNGNILRNKTLSSFGLVDSSYFDESLVLSGKASYLLLSNFEVLSFVMRTFPIPSLRKGFAYEQSISLEEYHHHMTLIGNKSNIKVSFTLSPTPLALSYQQTDHSASLPHQQTTLLTFCRDDSVPQLECKSAIMHCIHSVQGNVVPQESSTALPSLALDSARSIVLCTPTNRKLKPKIPVLIPSLIAHAVFQSLHFVITRLLLHTQPLQIEVAVKYLSASIWEGPQEEKNSFYPTYSYKAVVSDWQHMPVVYHKIERDGSTPSHTGLTLKQQSSLFNLCNEIQLSPPAKFAPFADSTKTSPNQQMLPSALSPSNSLGKSLCLQLKSVPSEFYSFPCNKILSFLLYRRLHEHAFVRGAIVVFCNSITTQSSEKVVQLCFVHTTCCSDFSPKYGSGTVMKSSFHTSITLLIILLPASFLPKSLPSVSQQTLPMCANVHPQAASLPMALVPARNIMHENITHTQVSIQAVQSIPKTLHSVPPFIQQTLCSSETASTPLALVAVENTMHESKTLTLVLQVSSQAVQSVQISKNTSLTVTTTSQVGDIHILFTCNSYRFLANLFCATRKVARRCVLTQLLQSLHYAGLVEAAGLFLQCVESPAHYQRVIWSPSNSLNFLKLAGSPTSQRMVVHATLSLKSPECPVRLDKQSQLVFPRAKSYFLLETTYHLPVNKPGLLASHENIHTTPRPSTITTTLGEGGVRQSPIQPVITRLHTTPTDLGREEGYPQPVKPVFFGMKYETSTHVKTAALTNLLYCNHFLHNSCVLAENSPEPSNPPSIKRDPYNQERPSNSGMLIPCDSQMNPQGRLTFAKHRNTMLEAMHVAAVFGCQLLVKCLLELFLIEFPPPHGSRPLTYGYKSVNKNQTPASREYGCSIDSLHCPWDVLPFTNSICGEFWCSIELLKRLWDALPSSNIICVRSTQVTWMMQHANRNYCHMNSQKLKWLISFSLHTPPHSTFNHSSWKISIGKSCNTHTFVCLIAPQISMGDKLTVSDAILPHNPNLLIARVGSAHPVSEQFMCHGATLLPQKHKQNFDLKPATKQGQVAHANLSEMPHFTANIQTTCIKPLSTCAVELKHHTNNNPFHTSSLHMPSIPSGVVKSGRKSITLTSPTAKCPAQKCVLMSTVSPSSDLVPTVRQETLPDAVKTIHRRGGKDRLHGKQRPIVLPFHKSPHPVHQSPLSPGDPFHKSPPLDLRTTPRIVTSPHSHDQKGSQKNSNGQGQESSGDDGSSPGGGGRGGENGRGPLSGSGSGGRDDDNGKKRNQDEKQEGSNHLPFHKSPRSVHRSPLKSPLNSPLELELRTTPKIVTSPHSHDQKDSQKEGNGQWQENRGNDGSSYGGGGRGGGNNSSPPSNSGSGGRDDDNDDFRRNKQRDGEKEDDDQQQEKKEATEGEGDTPSACKEDDWQSKQHTSCQTHGVKQHTNSQPHGVHLVGRYIFQQPEHEGKVDRRADCHGTDTQDEDQEPQFLGHTKRDQYATEHQQASVHTRHSRHERFIQGILTQGLGNQGQAIAHPVPPSSSEEKELCPCEHSIHPGNVVNSEEPAPAQPLLVPVHFSEVRVPSKEKAPVAYPSQKSIESHSLSLQDICTPDPQQSQATSPPPSRDVSRSQDQTPVQEKQHITEQSPVLDGKGEDEHFEVVGLQAVNAGVVSVSQDHSTGQCEDDPSPVTAASNCDKPVDDLQAPLPKHTETLPIQDRQDEHTEVIRPLEENRSGGDNNAPSDSGGSDGGGGDNNPPSNSGGSDGGGGNNNPPSDSGGSDGGGGDNNPPSDSGGSDGGGGDNNPPSDSGSRERDDNNKMQNGKKRKGNQQQKKKEGTEDEDDTPSACNEDAWESKQPTSCQPNTVYLVKEYSLQQPEHKDEVSRRLGTDTQDEYEQNIPGKAYETKDVQKSRLEGCTQRVLNSTSPPCYNDKTTPHHTDLKASSLSNGLSSLCSKHSVVNEIPESEQIHTEDEGDSRQPRCKIDGGRSSQGPAVAHSSPPSSTEKEEISLNPCEHQHFASSNIHLANMVNGEEPPPAQPKDIKNTEVPLGHCPVNLGEVRAPSKEKTPVAFRCQKSIGVYSLSLQNSGISDHQQPQVTSPPPSSDASLLHDHQTSALERKHITEQPPIPDKKGHDGQSEVVGLQEGNAGVVSASQDHSTGQHQNDPSLATTTSTCDKPVDDVPDRKGQDGQSGLQEVNASVVSASQNHSTGQHQVDPSLASTTSNGVKPVDDLPDRQGHDGHFVVVGVQEGNAGVVSGSQNHSTGQCEDDPSPAATASNCDEPVDDLQAPLPRDTKTPPIQEKQDEHSEVIRPVEENQETTHGVVTTEPLQSSSQNYGIKQYEDYSPVIPSRDESANDPVPKKNKHTTEHSLMQKRSSEDEHSEGISLPPVTQARQHDPSKDGKPSPPYKTKSNATTTGNQALGDISSEAVTAEPYYHSHGLAQHQDNCNPVLLPNSDQPVDDLQTCVPKEMRHITEQSPILEEWSQEPPTEDHVIGETTTVVVASEPLQPPSTCHGLREHQDDLNPGIPYMPASSEESADDPVPKEKRHVTEFSPLLEEYSQDACSEVIMPPSKTQLHGSQCNSTTSIDKEASPHLRLKKSQEKSQEAVTERQALEDTISDVTAAESPSQSDGIGQDDQISSVSHDSSNVKRHITKESPILEESKGACPEAVTADQLGLQKVTESQDKGQINTDVVMNNNVMPTTCPLPLPTTAQDMQDGLQSPQKVFYSGCEPETNENEVDDAESITSDFQQQLHGLLVPVQSEDIVHNTNTGATADMMPQVTATSAVFACQLVPHIPRDNVCEPVMTIPIEEAPVMVSTCIS